MVKLISIMFMSFTMAMCNAPKSTEVKSMEKEVVEQIDLAKYEKTVLASGCFWCVEAIFESVEGVEEVISGYAGGVGNTANYQEVSAGRTQHAEAVEIYYDPEVIDYETLLVVFFDSQDPTTLNQQGPDRGYQYRSAIFYKDEVEKKTAEDFIAQLEKDQVYDKPITTTIEKLYTFYPAEDYHQNYEANNPNNPYIKGVSIPRLKRFQEKHPELLKKNGNH